ncbi:Sporulation thiol-disulfide oxidoreductase A [Polaribacter huanghezhanensis]|uniref:TlpA family protein disulfide reductase n=1 Tax=Polaribacter huanghezhanensis TaxID=1354726 RepID=UPI00264754DC|nr:TlpA disulfide reductase family protein [Polaribacter huanghezhanensis]WKD86053.1 Sporulation thiol-disulfide oxidoreductase A [Polaribacter huanghezhanensis]
MIKKIPFFSLLTSILIGCSLNSPKTFSEKVLNDSFFDINNKTIQFKEILAKNKGQKMLINVWASWCGDCVAGFPNLKEFQKNNPEVKYVFLSIDRSVFSWKKAIEKYNIKGEHYFMKNGLNSAFGDFLNSNWIPRYLVVNEKGTIDLFKAKKITDKSIAEALKK